MKNTKMTISEKIAFLEQLEQMVAEAKSRQLWYTEYDDEKQQYTGKPINDEYNIRRYNAYQLIIEKLEEMA